MNVISSKICVLSRKSDISEVLGACPISNKAEIYLACPFHTLRAVLTEEKISEYDAANMEMLVFHSNT